MAVYGYTRVSTKEQAEGTSLLEQERKILAVATFHGDKVRRVFCDAGVSGSYALEARPEGEKLMAALKPGDTLICAKLDRAFRDATDALTKVKQWKKDNIKLILADIGIDSVTENGISKLFFTVLAGFAEWERDRILDRIISGRRSKKSSGGYVGGTAPFGYLVVGDGKAAMLEPDPKTFPAIQTIYELADAGYSLRKNAETTAQIHDIEISYQTVRRVLGDRVRGDTNGQV